MNRIPIIYFHSIAPAKNPKWYKSFLTFELEYFEDYIKYLHKNGYTFLFLNEYFELREKQGVENKKLICITFDDGYLDNYIFAYPILKKYGAKGTIFVSPEFLDERVRISPTLEDVWNDKCRLEDIETLGFLSWDEMREMEKSGVIDIQSHTQTHTKYYMNDRIRGFHNPKSDYLYPISNLYRERKAYYMTDPEFINLLPFGTPFFEQTSSAIVKKVSINPKFTNECVEKLKGYDWNNYEFEQCNREIDKIYSSFKKEDKLITGIESEPEYEKRLRNELAFSKSIIEEKLNKKVEHCSWPHGDYSDFAHKIAIEEGYRSSTIILKPGEENTRPDRFDRTGSGVVYDNAFLTLLKAKYTLNSYRGKFPYSLLKNTYYRFKYGA